MTLQFALLNAPGAYDSKQKMMGRQSAGSGFLRAALNANPDRIWCYAKSRQEAELFGQMMIALDPTPPELRFIDWLNAEKLSQAGTLYRPDPDIGENAWHRHSVNAARGYSLCGVTHTLSSQSVYSAICQFPRAPLYPWDALICTSTVARYVVRSLLDSEAERLCERFGVTEPPEPLLATIPLGVHCADFVFSADQRAASRSTLGIADDEVVVLFAGRLVFHAKAHPMPMFLSIERAAQRTGKKARLVLFGQYPNDAVAKTFVNEAKTFAPNVILTLLDGAVPENRDLAWSCADIFTSFSDNVQETFGLTPVEAMAAGIPTVVSDWNGYKDTVSDGIDGFKVPTWALPDGTAADFADRHDMRVDNYDFYIGGLAQFVAVDVGAATNAFTQLFASPGLRRRMGDNGRQNAKSRFDWSVIFLKYISLWQTLAEIRASAPLQPGENQRSRRPDRPDPSSLFASYPSHKPSGSTVIGIGSDIDTPLAEILALASTSFAIAVLPSEDDMIAVVAEVRQNEKINLAGLLIAIPKTSKNTIVRSVVWLAKMGVLSLSTPDT